MYSWWWVGLSPETCRVKAFAKNKPQLLHLVGIIFTSKAWCTEPQILSLKNRCKCLENRQSCPNMKTLSFYNKFGHRTALCTVFLIVLYWTRARHQKTQQQGEEAAITSYHGSSNQIKNTAVLNQIWNFSVNEQTVNGFTTFLLPNPPLSVAVALLHGTAQNSTQEHVPRCWCSTQYHSPTFRWYSRGLYTTGWG